jgi:glucosyl-3-phosphoglycerate phosphatase
MRTECPPELASGGPRGPHPRLNKLVRVILLRHGRTAWNAERRFQGQSDPPLDDVGRAQAYEVAALIAALAPALLISSDATRAVQTAQPIGELTGLDVIVDARLRERSLGHWEGLTRDEVAQRYPDEFADWVAGRDVSRRGGESREEVATRAMAAFAELPDVGIAVLVTHSATALGLCSALLGLRQEVHVLGPLANCHWSELATDQQPDGPRLWRLRAHNIGAPGTIAPLPVRQGGASEDAPDADA